MATVQALQVVLRVHLNYRFILEVEVWLPPRYALKQCMQWDT